MALACRVGSTSAGATLGLAVAEGPGGGADSRVTPDGAVA